MVMIEFIFLTWRLVVDVNFLTMEVYPTYLNFSSITTLYISEFSIFMFQ